MTTANTTSFSALNLSLGSDPEFVLFEIGAGGQPRKVSASSVLGWDTTAPFGCDGYSSTAELRPPAGKTMDEIIENIKRTIAAPPRPGAFNYMWAANAGNTHDYPAIGGHIHFGLKRDGETLPALGDEKNMSFRDFTDYFIAPLIGLPAFLWQDPASSERRGSYWDYGGIERKSYGFEYRFLNSWLPSIRHTKALFGVCAVLAHLAYDRHKNETLIPALVLRKKYGYKYSSLLQKKSLNAEHLQDVQDMVLPVLETILEIARSGQLNVGADFIKAYVDYITILKNKIPLIENPNKVYDFKGEWSVPEVAQSLAQKPDASGGQTWGYITKWARALALSTNATAQSIPSGMGISGRQSDDFTTEIAALANGMIRKAMLHEMSDIQNPIQWKIDIRIEKLVDAMSGLRLIVGGVHANKGFTFYGSSSNALGPAQWSVISDENGEHPLVNFHNSILRASWQEPGSEFRSPPHVFLPYELRENKIAAATFVAMYYLILYRAELFAVRTERSATWR